MLNIPILMEKLTFCYCGNAYAVIKEIQDVNDGTITRIYECTEGHKITTQFRLGKVCPAYHISEKTRVLYGQTV